MKSKFLFLIVLLLLLNNVGIAQGSASKLVAFNNRQINYMGRIGRSDSCASFYWSGSNVSIWVQRADTLRALLSDTRNDNYFYVVVDDEESTAKRIHINKAKRLYTLATFTDGRKHKVELFKITNTDEHITRFFGFVVSKTAMILKPPPLPKRTIEFFGNSITCGHGVDFPDANGDSGAPEYFNNYKAYGAITARHFGARYYCTSKSGIGVMVSWFPEIMPEIYDRLNPTDSTSKWNFKLYTPDIVVVNLFQNDSWIVNQPAQPQFTRRFGTVKPSEAFTIAAYTSFIKNLRTKYPKAKIICCLGNMDITKQSSAWPGYVEKAVASLNDKNIATHVFPYKNTPGHPKVAEQQAMADDLIHFINNGKYW